MKQGKLIIFSAPSGAGKTTIVKHLLQKFPNLSFSISATTRESRGDEQGRLFTPGGPTRIRGI
jgi:guanylate kinase